MEGRPGMASVQCSSIINYSSELFDILISPGECGNEHQDSLSIVEDYSMKALD